MQVLVGVDNFLTIMHVAATERADFFEVCKNVPESIAFEVLISCLTMMKDGKFVAAKLEWVKHLNKPISKENNAMNFDRNETDMLASLFQKMVKTECFSTFSSEWCPQTVQKSTRSGCFLR